MAGTTRSTKSGFTAEERSAMKARAAELKAEARKEDGLKALRGAIAEMPKAEGRIATRIPVSPDKHYDIYTSTTTGDPPVPSESRLTLLDPVGAGPRGPAFVQQALVGVGRVVAALRGQLRRLRKR